MVSFVIMSYQLVQDFAGPSTVSPLKHGHIWPMNAEVVPLADGAWLVMGGAMQQNYLHGVQRTQGEDEQRNALSMRQTKGHYYALYIYIYIHVCIHYTHRYYMIFYIISTRFFFSDRILISVVQRCLK